MSGDLVIRDATSQDADIVVGFNAALAWESEHVKLDDSELRRGVARALSSRDICLYFMAELGGNVVGQCMVTYEWSDWRDGWLWWFQSVYVHPEHRRRGVFAALYRHVEERARARSDVAGLRLYVERDNAKAMATYAKMGMSPTGHVVYGVDL